MRRALLAALVVAGCGGDENTPDAPVGGGDARIDGPRIDALPMVDAVPSTVVVMAGACNPPVPLERQLTTTATTMFALRSDLTMTNPSITITAGQSIEFSTTAGHNFASRSSVPPQFDFTSHAPGPHTACLTFAQATGGAIEYQCDAHPASMRGMLTVSP